MGKYILQINRYLIKNLKIRQIKGFPQDLEMFYVL